MTDLSDFGEEFENRSFYEILKNDESYKLALQKIEQEFIDTIERSMAYDFRYYQRQALSVFDFFQNVSREHYWFKEGVFESEFADGTIPFYGFEMATGSGKTLLIGSLLAYLHKYRGYKNFLIITPNTTIYEKTIYNFDEMNTKRVFSNYIDMSYNVVTGDNFIDKTSGYIENADFNIFIFNIQKFFDRDSGTLRLDKEWEQSFWNDGLGNTIPFREYLKKEKLVILTDEAHHYQNFLVGGVGNKSSGDIILSLKPEMVLEFTATAIAEEETETRRTQKIIYQYPINNFITDGYGKKVRAYGYTGFADKSETADVTEDDKKKFLVSYLIHLVKKRALEEILKPILLVRSRDILHANNLLEWIMDDLNNENTLIETTYNEIVKGEKFEINDLISRYITLDEFKLGIRKLPEKSFVYHSDNENEEEVKQKLNTIESNDQEVLIQIKKLEEGWDIQNPYTILILSVSKNSMKIYVKQLIGRGVRLFREKRKYDGLTGFIEKQQEILHVVCDKGSNFDEFVEEIRKELGFSKSILEPEMIEEKLQNKTIAKFKKYNELSLPIMRIVSNYSDDHSKLVDDLTYENLKLDIFVEENTYHEKNQTFWNWSEEKRGSEKDLIDDINLNRGEGFYTSDPLILEDIDIDKIVAKIISSQTLLPSNPVIKTKLKGEIKKLNKINIKFKNNNKNSKQFYVNGLIYFLSNFIDDTINKEYFITNDKIADKTLKSIFPDTSIVIKKSKSGEILNLKENRDININRGDVRNILITGFNKSYYEYNSFDSSHEYKLAYQMDLCEDIDFWIRNIRSYYHEYGIGNRYHPDFVIKHGSDLYIIEVKGTGYLETMRAKKGIEILEKLQKVGVKVLFLLDTTIDNKIFKRAKNFSEVIDSDDLKAISDYLKNL